MGIFKSKTNPSVPISPGSPARTLPVLPVGIDCRRWEAKEEGKKACLHYAGRGACGLKDEFVCYEWAKVNPSKAQGFEGSWALPLWDGMEAPEGWKERGRVILGYAPPESFKGDLLTDAAVDSLTGQALVTVLESPDLGEVFLVPEYTDAERVELTYADIRTLTLMCNALPGSRIKSIKRPRKKEKP